ncbi:MAG: hypothetical protein MUF59_07285 [Candidatus Krumholzibacteria bacterium]|nr:hypothetical protein [Candidatus Krumholzibacteria bacterium]
MLFVLSAACAPAPPSSILPGNDFTVEGRIIIDGPSPFDRRFRLEESDGRVWIVSGPRFESDLSMLDGNDVSVTGRVIRMDSSLRVMEIREYRLLPGEGMAALHGVVSVEDSTVFVNRLSDAKKFGMEGSLGKALIAFDRSRVWVWGESKSPAGGKPGRMTVRGYAILGPAE